MIFGCCIDKIEDVSRVREAGYDYYEFSGAALAAMSGREFQLLQMETMAARLPCLGLNSYSSGRPAIVGDGFDPGAARDYAELVCARAAELGVQALGIGAPKARMLPGGYPRARADAQCREFLGITAEVASRYGIYVMLEAMHDRACSYLNTTREALDLLQAAKLSGVGLVLDFYHMLAMGESLDTVAMAAPWLLHTHISTCGADMSRGFPGLEDEELYRSILRSLLAVDYDATMSVEAPFDEKRAPETLAMLRQIREELEAQG